MIDDKKSIDEYSRKYLSEHKKDFSYEAVLSKVRADYVLGSLAKYGHDNILEVGCGLNPLFLLCAYKHYTVVEPSREFVDYARKLARGKPGIDIIHGHIEDKYEEWLECGSCSFDFIIVSSLLHEVAHPELLLQVIHRLCEKNTVIHVNVPNVYSFHRLLAFEAGQIKSIYDESETEARFQRHTRFDRTRLINMVEQTGFDVISHGTYFIKPFSNEQMEQIINGNIVAKEIIEGLARMVKYMPELGCEMFVELRIRSQASPE